VMILVLKTPANAKLAAAKITRPIKDRTVNIFMVEVIHLVSALAKSDWFIRLQLHSTVSGPSNTVRLITSVRAMCGPWRVPFGAKNNAPAV